MRDGNAPDGTLHPGDLCLTGENSYPRYRVIAVAGDRAWIRDVSTGRDAVVEAGHCHRIADADGSARDVPPAALPEPKGPGPSPVAWPAGSPRP